MLSNSTSIMSCHLVRYIEERLHFLLGCVYRGDQKIEAQPITNVVVGVIH